MVDVIPFATANIMCSIAFGKRFEYNDTESLKFLDLVTEYFKVGTLTVIVGYFPWMRVLPWNRQGICFIIVFI